MRVSKESIYKNDELSTSLPRSQKWKLSKDFYRTFNKNFLNFKDLYINFKDAINKIKRLGLEDNETNQLIEAIISTYIDKKSLDNNFKDLNNEIKSAVTQLSEFIIPFINNEFEMLKENVEGIIIKIEKEIALFNVQMLYCYEHKHSFRKKYLFSLVNIKFI
ncbi:hypothetical protein [Spiroplasma endosymbiont of Nebria brevicollis]|uniref:hypothetical protein n=1 Tax=Spiroplasma endosymbiont of Nebria brevicollis TaxID=3066284 RepID=UPI00313E3526